MFCVCLCVCVCVCVCVCSGEKDEENARRKKPVVLSFELCTVVGRAKICSGEAD